MAAGADRITSGDSHRVSGGVYCDKAIAGYAYLSSDTRTVAADFGLLCDRNGSVSQPAPATGVKDHADASAARYPNTQETADGQKPQAVQACAIDCVSTSFLTSGETGQPCGVGGIDYGCTATGGANGCADFVK